MNSVDPRDRAAYDAHHPAPDSYAKSQIPHPSDHHRTRIVWLVVAGLVTFWGVVAWLCSGVGAI